MSSGFGTILQWFHLVQNYQSPFLSHKHCAIDHRGSLQSRQLFIFHSGYGTSTQYIGKNFARYDKKRA